jgi:hypothetical protein
MCSPVAPGHDNTGIGRVTNSMHSPTDCHMDMVTTKVHIGQPTLLHACMHRSAEGDAPQSLAVDGLASLHSFLWDCLKLGRQKPLGTNSKCQADTPGSCSCRDTDTALLVSGTTTTLCAGLHLSTCKPLTHAHAQAVLSSAAAQQLLPAGHHAYHTLHPLHTCQCSLSRQNNPDWTSYHPGGCL